MLCVWTGSVCLVAGGTTTLHRMDDALCLSGGAPECTCAGRGHAEQGRCAMECRNS